MKKKLDKYERELLQDFEEGKLISVKNEREEINLAAAAASNFLKKNEKITIRMSSFDLEQLRRKAAEEGLPYQSLISSIIHRFVTGRLINRDSM